MNLQNIGDIYEVPAYLTAKFTLPHDRRIYRPHDTRIYLNGHLVGEILNTIPEGTYIFEVDPSIVNYQHSGESVENIVSTKVTGINRGHYIIANQFKLIAPLENTTTTVVASTKEEAEEFLIKSFWMKNRINSGIPDIGIFANCLDIPPSPSPGQKIKLKLKVMNIGEQVSSPITISIYNYSSQPEETEKEELSSFPLLQPLIERIREYLPKKEPKQEAKKELLKVTEDVRLDPIESDQSVERIVEIAYTKEITRLKIIASCERDFDQENNTQLVTFISHDTTSPLAGVDYLDTGASPVLGQIFDVREPEIGTAVEIGTEEKAKVEQELDDVKKEIKKLDDELSILLDRLATECGNIPPFSESAVAIKCRNMEKRAFEIYKLNEGLYKKEDELKARLQND